MQLSLRAIGLLAFINNQCAGDVIARLVLVPCSQEARGLDAGPRLVERLGSIPDHRSAAIVARISREELAHVAVGQSLGADNPLPPRSS